MKELVPDIIEIVTGSPSGSMTKLLNILMVPTGTIKSDAKILASRGG